MLNRTLLIIAFHAFCHAAISQFSDDFNQPLDLSQTHWEGRLSDFMINPGGQLQLMAADAGSTHIYRKTNLPDSLEWSFYFKMDFSPSNSNKLRVYLHLDTVNLSKASGYYIEIGENGSEDRIRFVRMVQGSALTIAEGTAGLFAAEPAEAVIKIKKDGPGMWKIYVKKPGDEFFDPELELFDSTIKRHFDQFFMIECFFTSTRRDKFFFDDISVSEIVPDTEPPGLLQGKVLSQNSIELVFDEILDRIPAQDTGNYGIMPGGQKPQTIDFNPFRPNRVTLHFSETFMGNTQYNLNIRNLTDLSGNKMVTPETFVFYLTEKPLNNDLVINEILFNPYAGGYDFIELFNRSDKIINLKDMIVKNNQSNSAQQVISRDYHLFPGQYIAICPDTASLDLLYPVPDTARWLQGALPAFNNDAGNVTIYYPHDLGILMIDSVDYHEDMHFPLLASKKGVSLERIFTGIAGSDPSNWQSAAASFGNATPGYKNTQFRSQEMTEENMFWIENKIFSPDHDGFFDNLVIHYKMPEDGWVGTFQVYNATGNYIRTLVNNKILGTEGMVSWDGLSESQTVLPVGPYIILARVFHTSGKTKSGKLVCLLAAKL